MTSSEILFDTSQPRIVGVINVTPDSFSDGGRHFLLQDSLNRAELMVRVGADAIDIGGESTRPGSEPVSLAEELTRVIPLIDAIWQRYKIPISADTQKVEVAREAVKAGACMINDIGGLRNEEMAEFIAQENLTVVIMHMKGTPRTMQQIVQYDDVVAEIGKFFDEKISQCEKLGIKKFILDPGIGFGKSYEHNLQILRNLAKLKRQGIPLMIGHSNKAFIGKATGRDVESRLFGTVAVSALAIHNGADILRVHDVAPNHDAALMARAVLSEGV